MLPIGRDLYFPKLTATYAAAADAEGARPKDGVLKTAIAACGFDFTIAAKVPWLDQYVLQLATTTRFREGSLNPTPFPFLVLARFVPCRIRPGRGNNHSHPGSASGQERRLCSRPPRRDFHRVGHAHLRSYLTSRIRR